MKSIVTKYLAVSNVFFSFYENCAGTQIAMADFDNVADCCNNGSTNGVNFDFHLTEKEPFRKYGSSSFSWFSPKYQIFALTVQFFVMMMLFLAWNTTFLDIKF